MNKVTGQGINSAEKLFIFLKSIGYNVTLELQKVAQIPERAVNKLFLVEKDSILEINEHHKALISELYGRISSSYQLIDSNNDMYTNDRTSLSQVNLNNKIDVALAAMPINGASIWWKNLINEILFGDITKILLNDYSATEVVEEKYGDVIVEKATMFGYNIFLPIVFEDKNKISLVEFLELSTEEREEKFTAKFIASALSLQEQLKN